ncbi:NADH-quinone oxidoreductase subunit NuoG [Ruegeria sp. Ofav3-42]|uniref:NADH-quinone oxidoreductase subunit NuoG n=1 Tax=Ruegeria sp. Ofav3-42 TaxID=2917759 RepID=UPI001EF3EDDA|nr:NADH-quinone oxidoreductase subunit NuoG [Ruegeria sp. Ofav3-42]MCG7522335.1 NADH-quinone oxidoreductase subunit NuoG [Ruegeria sp. Ofav3-42]
MSDTSDITTLAVTIDDHELQVQPGTTILSAAEGLGIDIPTFCFQKRLPVLASCRMCLVEIEGQGKLQPACATAVMDGMVVRTTTDQVAETRSVMLDMLLANHPLDCPICDKGGECELQDMVMEYGPRESMFRDPKRVFHSKDIQLSPVVIMNVNRCIQCQRCVRMCEEVVGAVALGTVEKGMDTAVTGFEGSLASCDQCGNCIEVCPVGALMSFPYRYKSRPWDLVETDTICAHCGTGCHLTVGSRDGEFMRVRSQWDKGLNLETLCVRGRFGMDVFASPDRIKRPMVRQGDALTPVSWEDAGDYLRDRLTQARGHAAGIASPRLTNEALFQFGRLIQGAFDSDLVAMSSRFDFPNALDPLLRDFYSRAPFEEAIKNDCTLVIGSNVTEENPVSEYLLRGAVRGGATQLCLLSARPSRLDADARAFMRMLPGTEAFVLSELLDNLPDPATSKLEAGNVRGQNGPAMAGLDDLIAALSAAPGVTVLMGMDLFRTPDTEAVVSLLHCLLYRLQTLGKNVVLQGLFDRSNQMGALDMAGKRPVTVGEVLDLCAEGQVGTLYTAGADPVGSYPDRARVVDALKKVDLLIVQDWVQTDIADLADVVLPSASHGEESGTFTNNEGRVQVVGKFRTPVFAARSNIEIFEWFAEIQSAPLERGDQARIFSDIARTIPAYSGLSVDQIGPDGVFTSVLKRPLDGSPIVPEQTKLVSEEGLALITGNGLFYGGTFSEHSATLATVAEEPYVEMSTINAEERGLAAMQMVVVTSTAGDLTARLKVNPRFPEGLVFVPESYRSLRLNSLMKNGEYPCRVEVRKADS